MDDLRCLRCALENRGGRRYCAQCGAPLPVPCASCGFANAPEEKFCGGCGVPLAVLATANLAERGTAPPGAPAAPAPTRADDGERRPATVLFTDLTGYTRLSRSLDPEDVHELLGRYFATADAIVERWGGHVDKHIGDAVMAIFGAPVAHGDEGLRALRAAEEIQQAVPALGRELGQSLQVHIGIAAGEVMASGLGSGTHRAYTVIGNSVNLAARLLGLAGPGETLLDDAVRAATSSIARCGSLEDVAIKGLDTPIHAWRFVEFYAASTPMALTRFVGRDGELAQLAALLRSAQAGRGGISVILRGEPGIGKSRLVAELRRNAQREGFNCIGALVLDFGTTKGRDAIREVVSGLFGFAPSALPNERLATAARAAATLECTPDELPLLHDLLDVREPGSANGLYEAMDHAARQRGREAILVRMVRAASVANPVLLMVEDVHWADKLTLSYLAAVCRELPSMRVVMVLTTRTEGDPFDPAWRATVMGSPIASLDLGPLRNDDALALAGDLFSLTDRFAHRCIERAAGNPLFLEQLLRGAQEHGDQLPASLHSLVLARTDRLPERDRTALRAAAVVGQRFELAALRHLAQMPDYDCAGLVARFLVRPEGDEFMFAHALIRDGIYASLTRARKHELHCAAAQWYSEHDLSLRAEHLDRASSKDAPQAYYAAARMQADALHLEDALVLAKRGAVVAAQPHDRWVLNLLVCTLLREIGDGAGATAAGEVACAAAQSPEERCRALLGIAAGHRLVSAIEPALAALASAEPIACENGLTRELTELHYLRGNLHFARGEIAQCRAEHAKAYEGASQLADPEWEARALSGLADADYMQGLMRTAGERFTRCVALCDAHGFTRFAIPNRVMIGHCRIYLNEFDEGLAEMHMARDAAVRVGNRHAEMFATQSTGLLLTVCSRYAEALPYQEKSLAQAEALGARRYQAMILGHLAEARFMLGQRADARAHLERALALARETGMGFCGAMILGVMARVEEDPAQRDRHHAEAQALFVAGSVGHNYIHYYRNAIADALARLDWDATLRQAQGLLAFTQHEPLPYSDFLVRRAHALVTLALAPQDPAAQAALGEFRSEADRLRWPIGWPNWSITGLAPTPTD